MGRVPARAVADAAALARAAHDLYAAAPEEFVSRRAVLVREARAAGDAGLAREIGTLRKPTAAAWAVNLAVRRHPEQLERLEEVGRRLREAQARLDAARLTQLRADRQDLVAGFVAAARDGAAGAGRPLTAAVTEEVRATVVAALASPEVTAAVASGHLTRALSYSGFGEVDLSDAVARTSSGAVLRVLPGQAPGEAGSVPVARAEVETARAALDAADEAFDAADEALGEARRGADRVRLRVRELETALARARAEQQAADEAVTTAAAARRAAVAARHTARRALERARHLQ